MALTPARAAQFRVLAAEIYGVDPDYEIRLRGRFPLYALRWALIVLNEFIPSIWQQRLHAGLDQDWAAAKDIQLEKARGLVAVADAG